MTAELAESKPTREPETAVPHYLIEVTGVSKKYCRDFRKSLWYAMRDVAASVLCRRHLSVLREDEFWAVKDVSFNLSRGESLGLIGHNGAGKSTLLKMLTGQRTLTTGNIVTRGRVVALTELGLGFDPVLTGRENAYMNAAVFGVPRGKMEPVIDQIIDFAGIREFIDSAVQTYSSGMKARLGFSVATHLNPDILIVDEVLAVGDLSFRRKCVSHIQGYLRRGGSMVLVAHDPYLIQTICNRCLVMEKGRVTFDGPAIEGVGVYFQIGHAATMQSVSGNAQVDSRVPAAGDGHTVEENWLSEAPHTVPSAALRPAPTDEQPVVIDRFEVTPEWDLFLHTGGSAIVKVYCRSLIDAEIGWGFSICTADLHTTIASQGIGLDGRSVTVQPGENEFRCRIEKLPLRPGIYSIRGGVTDVVTLSPIAVRGFQDSPNFFTVKAQEADQTTNYQSLMNDLVAISVEWLS